MPRRLRIHERGAFYHVTSRGNNKEQVFFSDEDYSTYTFLMKKYSLKYCTEIHAYALMPNHIHLLARVDSMPLQKFMQGLQQSYAQIFNKRYDRVGHVFQGRYNAHLISNEQYLLQVFKYIHLNPVRAGLADDPKTYRWSSLNDYTAADKNSFIETGFMKKLLIEYGISLNKADFSLIPDLAPEELQELPQKAGPANREIAAIAEKNRPTLIELAGAIEDLTGISLKAIKTSAKDRATVLARYLFIYGACRLCGFRVVDTAQFLDKNIVSVSIALNKMDEQIKEDSALKKMVQELTGNFKNR